jgi:uncharacterized protein YecT (DUF1311 family)
MTTHELDQPRMIYTGEMPPHLTMRPVDPYDEVEEEEADFEPAADARPSILPIALATGAALALGIAIGVFAPALFRGPSARPATVPPVLQRAVVDTEPAAPSESAPAAPLPETALAEATPPAVRERAPVTPLRLAVARLGPAPAARPMRSPAGGARNACMPYTCTDPAIVAADSDLQQAYQRALSSGAPADQLRAGQIDWLLARQAAASRSPADLAGVYRQRIAQLNAIADEPPH